MALDTQKQITDGPSKFDLMLALFDRAHGPRPVVFYVKQPDQPLIMVIIHELGLEDGSGASWLFKGSTTDSVGGRLPSQRVSGYFRTDKRTGYIKDGW